MINSLSKDSHILRPLGNDNSCRARKNVKKTAKISHVANNCEISVKKPAEISFSGLFSPSQIDNFYQSSGLKKVLKFANDQQLVFGATFALLLTCIMRPAAIIIMPSKKNKEDQIYASAHSIASGLIGFAISTVLFTPVSSGIKKFGDACIEYRKSGKNILPDNKAFTRFIKENSEFIINNKTIFDTGKTYLDRLPDIVTAIPKGILTVALIPPILKYLFGIEKNKKPSNKGLIEPIVDYSLLNFKSAGPDYQNNFASFKGGIK